MKNDFRARSHPAWWAFAVHRGSGVLLSLFLPLHFWALGNALQGEAKLESFLRWSDQPAVKGRRGRTGASPRGAHDGRTATPRAGIPAVARLAEEPARSGGGGDSRWRASRFC
jgi:hypothetical protein